MHRSFDRPEEWQEKWQMPIPRIFRPTHHTGKELGRKEISSPLFCLFLPPPFPPPLRASSRKCRVSWWSAVAVLWREKSSHTSSKLFSEFCQTPPPQSQHHFKGATCAMFFKWTGFDDKGCSSRGHQEAPIALLVPTQSLLLPKTISPHVVTN